MQDVEALFADPPFVGRPADLSRLVELLDRPPAVALVRGGHGSGRSTLLHALRRNAEARRWRTVQTRPVRPDTGREDLERELRTLAGLSETVVGSRTGTPGARAGARVQALDAPVHATSGSPMRADEVTTIAKGLAAQQTLLLLDDYRPDPEVERWLLSRVLGPLQRDGAPVLVVVAGRAADLGVLHAETDPDVVVDAQPPTEPEVRGHVAALGAHLHPPAQAAEIDALVAGLVAEPRLVAPLIRTLAHGRADE